MNTEINAIQNDIVLKDELLEWVCKRIFTENEILASLWTVGAIYRLMQMFL